jgi:thioredoxin reductase (NADPH)
MPQTPPETPDLHGAYPRLPEARLAALQREGERRPARAGDVLFREGDEHYDFYVVLDGLVAIVTGLGTDHERTFAVHGPGRFLGELSLLVGQAAFFSAVVVEDGELLVVPARRLRELVASDAELGDLVLRAYLVRRELLIGFGAGFRILGSRFSPDTRRLREFAARNRLPHQWIDLEDDKMADETLRRLGVAPSETPLVVWGEHVLRNPSNADLAELIGLRPTCSTEQACDLLVVGAGPSGLAASVYGASEGLETITVDAVATGGQAGTSSRIENYLGFPSGISGAELADRAEIQAEKFGARIVVPAEATALEPRADGTYGVRLDDGTTVSARAVVVASGVRYRRLPVARLEEFEGASVFYAATLMEAQMCVGDPVVVVGGGNSAGQATLFLSHHAVRVVLVVRGDDLSRDMSRYLVDQIERNPLVEVRLRSEVRELVGEDGALEAVVVEERASGEREEIAARKLFVFIGAAPHTGWLEGAVELDPEGFVVTGRDGSLLQTTLPGVYAVGDVRSGSVKRVASAVGEGSMVVRLVHEQLGDQAGRPGLAPPVAPAAAAQTSVSS